MATFYLSVIHRLDGGREGKIPARNAVVLTTSAGRVARREEMKRKRKRGERKKEETDTSPHNFLPPSQSQLVTAPCRKEKGEKKKEKKGGRL